MIASATRYEHKADPAGLTEGVNTYDWSGRVVSQVHSDGNNNPVTFTDRKGQTTTFTYDNMDRIIRADYHDGSNTVYAYDEVGRMTTVDDSVSGQITFHYTSTGCDTGCSSLSQDKVAEVDTPLGTIQYTYDRLGRRKTMTVAGQPTVNYTYDADGRLTGVSTQINGNPAIFGLSYDDANRRRTLTRQNGTTTIYGYDDADQLLDLQHLDSTNAVLDSLTYTYDPNGNRTLLSRSAAPPGTSGNATDISYNQANQMQTFNAMNITSDLNGNMTSRTTSCGTTNYTWDVRNRLVGISGYKPDCTPLTASFKYDAMGRRIEKMVNGGTIKYLYDGLDIVQEIQNSTVTANYVRTLNIDEPLARVQTDGKVRYYHTDVLGSVIELTDETGTIKTTYSYDPFGNVTITGEAFDNPFQYTGRENDGTGLYYYRARYYNPELQRFISEDPIGFEGGINMYAYVGNSPVNWIDPWGLFKYSPTAGDPVDDTTKKGTECFETCSGLEITVTAGKESGHSKGSPHEDGQACDIGKNSNSKLNRNTAEKCFKQCFDQKSSYGQEESNHYHFQTRPGIGGATGFAPGIK